MKFVELFAGAGGMTMGFEMAGWECVGHAEIDKHARAILRHKWPNVPLHGDVCKVSGEMLPEFDLLTFGAPCQDLSIAGKRAGLFGERSSLFFEAIRIWKETKVPYCLYENVLGALSSNKGEDFGVVLSTIVGAAVPVPADGWRGAGVASGPAGVAAWRVLDAQYFGVPQRRRRVFVLGVADGSVDPAEVLSLGEGMSGHPAPRRQAREGVAADSGAGVDGKGAGIAFPIQNPELDKEQNGLGIGDANAPMYTLEQRGHGVVTYDTAKAVNISAGIAKLDDTMGTLGARSGGQEVGAQTRGVVLTYDTRGNGDGRVVNTMAGDHQNRVTDYTALVLQRGIEQVIGVDKQSGHPFADIAPTMKTDQAHDMGAVILRNREGKPGGGKGPLVSAERERTLGTSNDQVVFTRQRSDEYIDGAIVDATIAQRDYKSASDLIVNTGDVYAANTCSYCSMPSMQSDDDKEKVWEATGGRRGIQAQEVLQQDLYGDGIRCEASQAESIVDDRASSRQEDVSSKPVQCLRCGQENGRTSHQRELAGQQAGEPKEAMSILSHQDTQVGIPRRLTPIETERLMGWPDDHTAFGVDEQGREYALADTARYKACGNGVASPVAAWIAFRLRDALDTPRERA